MKFRAGYRAPGTDPKAARPGGGLGRRLFGGGGTDAGPVAPRFCAFWFSSSGHGPRLYRLRLGNEGVPYPTAAPSRPPMPPIRMEAAGRLAPGAFEVPLAPMAAPRPNPMMAPTSA